MYRIDVVDRDNEKSHIASVVWVRFGELDATVRRRLGLDNDEWYEGKAMDVLTSLHVKCRDSPHLTKASKPTASGVYAECGFGCGAGSQNSSFDASPCISYDGIHFPYVRNPSLSSELQQNLGEGLAIINMFLEDHCPDLHMRENRMEDSPTSLAIADGLCYPQPPIQGPLKGLPSMNAQQIALRLVGWCQKGGAHGAITGPTDLKEGLHYPSGTRQEKESLKRLQKSKYGGSGLHLDWMDPRAKVGFATIYVCFIDEEARQETWHAYAINEDGDRRREIEADLILFQAENGGRAALIETMRVGFLCVVFHHASEHLHGSVFPNDGRPQVLHPFVEGLKIVCYQTCNKLVKAPTNSIGCASVARWSDRVFCKYLRAHFSFLAQLLREKRWYDLALCHAVPLLNIIVKAHAYGETGEEKRYVYRKIFHSINKNIVTVFATVGSGRVKRFIWAPLLGWKLKAYYRKDTGMVIMNRRSDN
mmetsp:Transcript_20551/g.58955  ORF Transcript_20551/g.58955 Transcript_20551/m.58955 type:complete len:477 (-) Transcript_20551:875-2305(-)